LTLRSNPGLKLANAFGVKFKLRHYPDEVLRGGPSKAIVIIQGDRYIVTFMYSTDSFFVLLAQAGGHEVPGESKLLQARAANQHF
jgi:hypothetical protein